MTLADEDEILSEAKDDTGRELRLMPMGRSPLHPQSLRGSLFLRWRMGESPLPLVVIPMAAYDAHARPIHFSWPLEEEWNEQPWEASKLIFITLSDPLTTKNILCYYLDG